ncbi:hypothetical protein NC653_009624 [Populus alba x Populus x berolinensis]|uniref:Uncharacterized protein n=1 Tax=Populus alba x Populus x berolinensis TaxID=444605 RepID=A0AAD6WBU1_9ROSI|nr:hypothetical protein NC653_009624 [Populus alba x Populus x berolinensis]
MVKLYSQIWYADQVWVLGSNTSTKGDFSRFLNQKKANRCHVFVDGLKPTQMGEDITTMESGKSEDQSPECEKDVGKLQSGELAELGILCTQRVPSLTSAYNAPHAAD